MFFFRKRKSRKMALSKQSLSHVSPRDRGTFGEPLCCNAEKSVFSVFSRWLLKNVISLPLTLDGEPRGTFKFLKMDTADRRRFHQMTLFQLPTAQVNSIVENEWKVQTVNFEAKILVKFLNSRLLKEVLQKFPGEPFWVPGNFFLMGFEICFLPWNSELKTKIETLVSDYWHNKLAWIIHNWWALNYDSIQYTNGIIFCTWELLPVCDVLKSETFSNLTRFRTNIREWCGMDNRIYTQRCALAGKMKLVNSLQVRGYTMWIQKWTNSDVFIQSWCHVIFVVVDFSRFKFRFGK